MKEVCAWCGEYKEVWGWQEGVDVDEKGGEVHTPICKECNEAITGEEPPQDSDSSRNCNNCDHRILGVFEDKEPCAHCYQYDKWAPRESDIKRNDRQ